MAAAVVIETTTTSASTGTRRMTTVRNWEIENFTGATIAKVSRTVTKTVIAGIDAKVSARPTVTEGSSHHSIISNPIEPGHQIGLFFCPRCARTGKGRSVR